MTVRELPCTAWRLGIGCSTHPVTYSAGSVTLLLPESDPCPSSPPGELSRTAATALTALSVLPLIRGLLVRGGSVMRGASRVVASCCVRGTSASARGDW